LIEIRVSLENSSWNHLVVWIGFGLIFEFELPGHIERLPSKNWSNVWMKLSCFEDGRLKID
jgi:hypothetical protein